MNGANENSYICQRYDVKNEMRRFLFSCLIGSMITGCSTKVDQDAGKTVFRYNEAANITSLDPAYARDQANIWATHQPSPTNTIKKHRIHFMCLV